MATRRRASDWEEKAPKDRDPEAEPIEESENESGSEEAADENAGTEHYVTVGKSKLREKEGVSLGPQYRGARVSRDALNDSSDEDGSDVFEDAREDLDSNGEEFDDPETADLAADEAAVGDEDVEISSDNAFGDSDDELHGFISRSTSQPKDKKGSRDKRLKAADFISDEEEGSDDDNEGAELDDEDLESSDGDDEDLLGDLEGSEDDEDDEDDAEIGSGDDEDSEEDSDVSDEDDDEEDDDEEDDDDQPRRKSSKSDARAEQRKLMSEGQKALAATISAAVQQDAQKGLAVREQRKTFDGLLNIRIRLQKALVATNSFSAVEPPSKDGDEEEGGQSSEPYEAAEEAALKLLNTLDSFRASLLPAELAQQAAGAKRKRGDYDTSTSSEAIWEGIQEAEQRASKYRKKVLETWSAKTRSANVEVKSRNLVSTQTSIVASLEDQLLNVDRLVKRTRTPRSCAPAQVARKVNEDPEVYDDADFYQLLLKELVEQRTSDTGGGTAAQPTVRWAAMKEAKTKKHVDRRASKGRKMRFNVHEKLQNFMAPEDRRAWEQDAIDRLFGTLFGQKMELSEQASDAEMEDDEDVDAEEAGLRLFRN
ncbi:TRAUB domain-containing protein [Colletotrichum graminicola]|uniref:Protein BFR2 n=1 Tax=Colletotrichum graminicola (strain M1.001 / M2 / FGSC 10212) TaxID=645133 RepID=E3QX42_COLGM|nr:TRAUB domain-containing protein [Colletotrichum graminicola M1.001]EFQ35430.1 TRAUB domain-containing protein [Colletotrichum graminicola M1.001]WDK22412.1 TRAUB domain-containing protein [Colletotrichum graminicola]